MAHLKRSAKNPDEDDFGISVGEVDRVSDGEEKEDFRPAGELSFHPRDDFRPAMAQKSGL